MGRQAGILAGLTAGFAILLWSVHQHYPVQHWLVVRYAGYWSAALAWALACLAAGHVTLRWSLGRRLPWLEQLAVAFALGVFEFQCLMFVTGIARLYGAALFFALPAALLALGGAPLLRDARRVHARLRGRRMRASALGLLVIVFGAVCLLAVYLPTMLPSNSAYDARWRHLVLAEQYAVYGGIRRFDEGWLFAGSPQFTSLLYTWAFLLPVGALFDRVELCAHLEYVTFLFTTLIGIPAVVRRLVPGANPATVWAARFVFPGVLLYDSSLSIGADHVGAAFAPALFLVSMRAFSGMNARLGLVLGACIAAAICAKETTALLLVPPAVLTVVLRFLLDVVRSVRLRAADRNAIFGALAAGAGALVFSTPHWLKNLIWYGDPLYPYLHSYLALRPWHSDASYVFEWGFLDFMELSMISPHTLVEILKTLATFSFVPHDWWTLHRNVPVFGSLFTLLILVLPFLSRSRRIWALVAWVHVALVLWCLGLPFDRHLQGLMPWMAAVVAAICTRVWRTAGGAARTALAALIALQVVWGSDVYFFPNHVMIGTSAIKAVADFLAKGFLGDYEGRLAFSVEQASIGQMVPPSARLLVHERRDHLGFGRTTITDVHSDQYAINYSRLGDPQRIYDRLHQLGVTHLTFADATRGFEPLGGDIAFYEFARRHAGPPQRAGYGWLAAMPGKRPQAAASRKVAVLGCDPEYASGLYELSDLRVPRFGPSKTVFPKPRAALGAEAEWAAQVFAIAIDADCKLALGTVARQQFERVVVRSREFGRAHEIWLRRR